MIRPEQIVYPPRRAKTARLSWQGTMARRPAAKRARAGQADRIGKRISFDRETWNAVALLARDQMKDLDEITEEAFRDLLRKYGRSADFREALKLSARAAKTKGRR
jgi:hypothetical protein